jgi:hypothetical protein
MKIEVLAGADAVRHKAAAIIGAQARDAVIARGRFTQDEYALRDQSHGPDCQEAIAEL